MIAEPNLRKPRARKADKEPEDTTPKGAGGRKRKEDLGMNLATDKPNPQGRNLTKAEKQKRYRMEDAAFKALFPTFSKLTITASATAAENRAVALDVDAVSNVNNLQ